MAEVEKQVSASNQDSTERESDGACWIDDTIVRCFSSTSSSVRRWGGCYFVLAIPQGSTINSAYLQPYVSNQDANLDIYFQKAASPAVFTTGANDISGRTRTTASVPWVQDSVGAGRQNSPDLATPLQEVVDLYTTTAVVVILKPRTNALKQFSGIAYDLTPAQSCILVVNYTPPVGPPTVTTQAVSGESEYGMTGNGNIIDLGGENATRRGFCYKKGLTGDPTTSDSVVYEDGSFGTGAFALAISGLDFSSPYRVRAYAVNSHGTGYGDTVAAQTSTVEWSLAEGGEKGWFSVVWSPELEIFVVVSETGTGYNVMTSPDGITWTLRETPADNEWRYVTWSPELTLFVAVAQTGAQRVMTSPDGINWTLRNCPGQDPQNIRWVQVRWVAELELFVALGAFSSEGQHVMTSPDGINWTLRNTPANYYWRGLEWSPDLELLVAVSYTGTETQRVMTSPDGINWTLRTTPADNVVGSTGWYAVRWSSSLSLFAVVANGGDSRVMTSPDGINWTLRQAPVLNGWVNLEWSPELGLFVAIAYIGTSQMAMASIDGINWVMSDLTDQGVPCQWYGIEWSPELNIFVVVCKYGTGVDYRVAVSGEIATVPTLTSEAVSSIGSIAATGNGTITNIGGSTPTKRGFCWNKTGSPTVADDTVEEDGSFSEESFSLEMTGLDPGDHYYVRAYAYNDSGYGYGTEVEFDALAAVAETQAATNIQTAQATGNGHVEDADSIDEIGFDYGTESGVYTDEVTDDTGGFEDGNYSLDMTGLDGSTKYYFRAKAHHTVSGWIYGSELSFTTLADVPTVRTDPPSDAAEDHFDPVGNMTSVGGENADERGFVFGLTHQADPGDVAPGSSGYDDYVKEEGEWQAGEYSLIVDAVTASRVYYVRAYAHNSYGYSYGGEIMVLTSSTINILYPISDYSAGVRFGTGPGGGYPRGIGDTPSYLLCRYRDTSYVSGGRWGYQSGLFIYERNYYNDNFYTTLFNMSDPIRRTEGIVKIKWKGGVARCSYPYGKYKRAIRTHSTTYEGSEGTLAAATPDPPTCEIFTTNPNTGEAWTLEEALDIIMGVSLGEEGSYGIAICDSIEGRVCWAEAEITADSAQRLDANTIKLYGTIVEDEAEPSTVYFEWGPTASYGNTTTGQTDKHKGESFTDEITSSDPVHFRAVIETECGETFYSADYYFAGGGKSNITIIP